MNKKEKKKIIVDPSNMQGQDSEIIKDESGELFSTQKEQIVDRAMQAMKNSASSVSKGEGTGKKEGAELRSTDDRESEQRDFKFERINMDKQEEKKHSTVPAIQKKKNGLVIGIAVAATVLLVGVIVYGSVAIHYQSCFLPGTYINDIDCSELEVAQVTEIIRQQNLQGYVLEVQGKDEEGKESVLATIKAEDVGMELKDDILQVQAFFDQQNPMFWIKSLGNEDVKHAFVEEIVYNEGRLEELVATMDFARNEQNDTPQNAYLSAYSEELGGYEIIPEVQGNYLDVEKATELIKQALYHREASIDLMAQGCYAQPEITIENEDLIALRDTLNKWLSTAITYDWNGAEVVLDKELLSEWISVEDDEAVLDEAAVADFVEANAKKYDTYGKNRKFVTTLGVELTLPSGAFGWKTDREKECEELIALIKEGTVGDREPLYSSKAPWKGTNDIGNTYVEIDLTNQHLYLYQKGQIVLETDFVSGLMTRSDCITPQGVFRITYKTTNATLRGGDYAQYVYYWMPFHGNFGMHDATWRTEFGGTIYLTDGSHGCINLPLDKAAEIYNQMYAGHPVICYYY